MEAKILQNLFELLIMAFLLKKCNISIVRKLPEVLSSLNSSNIDRKLQFCTLKTRAFHLLEAIFPRRYTLKMVKETLGLIQKGF